MEVSKDINIPLSDISSASDCFLSIGSVFRQFGQAISRLTTASEDLIVSLWLEETAKGQDIWLQTFRLPHELTLFVLLLHEVLTKVECIPDNQ